MSTLADILDAKDAQLSAKLAEARATLAHAGNRGNAAEAAFRDFLTLHLPRQLDVGQGEVIDTDGNRSRHMDVVVTTQDQPLRSDPAEPGLFLVEGVFALGEVKARLTTDELNDVITKGESVKELRKMNLRGAMVYANPSDRQRWVDGPPPVLCVLLRERSG